MFSRTAKNPRQKHIFYFIFNVLVAYLLFHWFFDTYLEPSAIDEPIESDSRFMLTAYNTPVTRTNTDHAQDAFIATLDRCKQADFQLTQHEHAQVNALLTFNKQTNLGIPNERIALLAGIPFAFYRQRVLGAVDLC